MRILVNYSKGEQNYLPILQYHLRQRKFEAVATSSAMTLSELLDKAQAAHCQGILLCNEETLRNIVPGEKASLDLYRGSRFSFSCPVIVCNSLAHTHTVDHGSWLLENDLDKFYNLTQKPVFTFHVLDTQDKFADAYETLSSSILIAYDIETVTLNETEIEAGETLITCVSWSCLHSSGEIFTFTLPFLNFLESHWPISSSYQQAIRFLQEVNALPIPKVMHNGMYDIFHSLRYNAPPVNWVLDTMALAWCQYSSLPKSLDFVASITLPFYCQWKTQAAEASAKKDIFSYWGYNAKDTWHTLHICIHYLKHLPAYARKNYQTQFPLVYPFTYAAFEGLLIDQDKRNELRNAAQAKLDKALADLRVMFANPEFNPGSPKQVAFYIYDIFGAKDPRIGFTKTSDGKRTKKIRGTDEKNLKAIGEQHPILLKVTDALLTYRENAKAISTYFDFIQYKGRLLFSINPFGTDSGRASSSTSPMWCGAQIQNIPPYAKEMLGADEENELFEADNSQSEARCTAYLSQETHLIAALENKEKDFYKTLGTLFFGIPYEEVTKDFRNNVLKKIVHGTNYMMGAGTFVENATAVKLIEASGTLGIKVTLEQTPKADEITIKQFGQKLLDSYHVPFPRVKVWYSEVKHEILTTHMLVSPLGWTRYFFGDISKDHNLFRSAVSHGPQNLSVCILNKGIWKLWQLVKKEKGAIRFKAQIHDSAFCQVRKDRPELKQEVLSLLRNPVKVHGRTLLIPVDYKDGPNWANMEEHK